MRIGALVPALAGGADDAGPGECGRRWQAA